MAECGNEMLKGLHARGVNTIEAFEQELNKSVNREYFIGKQFTYEEINALPRSPGVYGFKNRGGSFLYIGESRNLRRRVLNYFNDTEESPEKIGRIRTEAHTLITYACGSELECLIYEHRLIKKHQPIINTQRQVSERRGDFVPLEDSIALLPHAEPGKGMSFWFRASQKITLRAFTISFPAEDDFVRELDEFFFTRKLPARPTDFAEYEIAFRWIKANYESLVILSVGRYASAQEVYRAMPGYWKEVV
jgi:hypothetical protein